MKLFHLNILLLIFLPTFLSAQNIKGQWTKTEKQVSQMNTNTDLIGTWISSVNDPLLSFSLNPDNLLTWTNDSLNFDLPDSLYWSKPIVRWTVKGDKFYIFTPDGQEKNKWTFTVLGAYYLKKDKLYIGNCFETSDEVKKFIKQKAWKEKRDFCVHELIKNN